MGPIELRQLPAVHPSRPLLQAEAGIELAPLGSPGAETPGPGVGGGKSAGLQALLIWTRDFIFYNNVLLIFFVFFSSAR
jgi:hypothetical protein